MLKKSQRLTKRQFEDNFKTGKRFHFPHLSVVYTPHGNLHASVVVGKKVAKSAVTRNTLRRRIYAVLRQQVKQSGRTGVFIVLTKPSLASLSRKQAHTTVTDAIASVLKKT